MDVHREMADSIMEIYLINIDKRPNEIMKVITIITPISCLYNHICMDFLQS